MNSSRDIRVLTAADTDALVAFYHSLPPETVQWFEPFVPADRSTLMAHLRQADANEAISIGLVRNNGGIVGHAFVMALSSASPVFGCGLRVDARGAGFGRRLMCRVLDEADRRRLPRVTLTVFKDNTRARRLYESCGFVTTGEAGCRQPGDSLAMERLTGGTAGGSASRALLQMLNGYRPDKAVWTADLSYWIAGQQAAGTDDPAWRTERGYLELHRTLGVMPYYYYERFWTARPVFDASVRVREETAGHVTARIWETPVGTLREESSYLPESACHGVTRHPVETGADLDVLLYLLEHRRLEPDNLADYSQRRQLWSEYDGLPCLGLPRSPLSALAYEWAGVQNMVFLLLDHEARARQVLALMEAQEAPILEAVCNLAPPLVHFPDNLSSDNLAGLYDEYLAPTHRRRLQRLHAAGVKAAVHLDGTVRGLLPKLAAVGFDAIEALTPQPAGDLTPAEMRKLANRPDLILWGGVPGALFPAPTDWPRMNRHLDDLLAAWAGQPFVIGVADQVPPDGDIDFCRKIAERVASETLTS